MTKAELRKKYKLLRKELSFEQREHLSMEIANNLLTLPIWQHSFYHLFLPIAEQNELNTDYILHILQGKDKNVVISKSDFATGALTNYLLTDTTVIKKNEFNIPEPMDGIEIPNEKLNVVFVPLLAYDIKGNRVGYGKGFYDRFLNDCSSEVVKVGLSFFDPEDGIDDVHENDVKLDYCVSPRKSYYFN